MDTEEIIGYEALYNSMMKCKKGVMWKDSTAFFVHNWMREIGKLERQLHDDTYQERPPKFFKVMEPKEREIMSIAFRDRVYQRSLNDVEIYPRCTRWMRHASYGDSYNFQKNMREFYRSLWEDNDNDGIQETQRNDRG